MGTDQIRQMLHHDVSGSNNHDFHSDPENLGTEQTWALETIMDMLHHLSEVSSCHVLCFYVLAILGSALLLSMLSYFMCYIILCNIMF